MMNTKTGTKFEQLQNLVKRLRGPRGCPWDREQTAASLLPYFLEEAYEVMESVDEENWPLLKEELGDLLLHVVFQASIAAEANRFTLEEVLETINAKLVRRHPHVFGEAQAEAPFHAKRNWEAAKHAEKKRQSRLEGVPVALPALVRAQRLQQKASFVGFDWEKVDQVWEKVYEEIQELKEAQAQGKRPHLEEEIGDVLFAVVNLARFFDLSAEDALRKTNRKFTRRFQEVEGELKRQGKTPEEATLKEMDHIWNNLKSKTK